MTGSGKTYTMFGPDGVTSPSASFLNERFYAVPNHVSNGSIQDNRGLVYRVCSEILYAVGIRRKMGIDTTIGVSYVEIFGMYELFSVVLVYAVACKIRYQSISNNK